MRTLPLLTLSFLASTLAAQRVAEVEPNNTVATAQTLTFGQQVDCNLTAGDQDWFTFTVTTPSEVHITTAGNFAVSSTVDTCVLLYDASGTTRLAWNDNARGSHSDMGCTLQPGVYTALVVGKLATTAGDYALDFVAYPATTINTIEAAEPNGDPSLGEVPTPITLGGTFAGSLSSPTDVDWYQFSIAVETVVQAFVYDDSGVPQLDNTLIGLRQFNGATWTAIGTTSTLATGHRAFNLAHVAALTPGIYAIAISAGSAAAGTAPLNYTKTGNYTVRTRSMDFLNLQTVLEAPEPNDFAAAAPLMSIGDIALGNTTGSADGDWYAFFATSPMTIAAMTETGAVPGVTDTTIRLRDSAGTTISTATTGGATGQSHGKMVFTLPAAGFYYLEVAGGVLAASGNYALRLGAANPILQSASFAQQPPSTNACPGSNALRPQLTRANGEVAQIGTHFTMRVNNALPSAGVISLLGFSNTVASGGIPLPLDLTTLGAPGCFLRVDPAQSNFGVADANGLWFWDLPIPNDLFLSGLPFWVQVACFDPTLNAFGASVSNEAKCTLGERGY
jgi:hypothetical protein